MSISKKVSDNQGNSEVKDLKENFTVPVMEHFYTLQGEGAHAGKAAYFIRLGGCDVGCHWCDVKESWDMEAHPVLSCGELAKAANEYPSRIVVVTGGEPTMHDLGPLTETLKMAEFFTHIETAGTCTLTGIWDWVTFSPKKFKQPDTSIYEKANELKMVIFHPNDFLWAEEYAAEMPSECLLFLQPEWSKREKLEPLIIEYIKKHPKWRLSLQTHKYLGIE